MNRELRDHLADMLDYAGKAVAFVGAMSVTEFVADERTFLATIRAIEIVGEAARRIPEEFRQRVPAIPWRDIVGMRNVLAHNYDGTDPDIIHHTATVDMAELTTLLPEAIALAETDTGP